MDPLRRDRAAGGAAGPAQAGRAGQAEMARGLCACFHIIIRVFDITLCVMIMGFSTISQSDLFPEGMGQSSTLASTVCGLRVMRARQRDAYVTLKSGPRRLCPPERITHEALIIHE